MVVHDFDFHPDEPTVRVFATVDVPRLDDVAFVSRVRTGDDVLHHYAWASRWFKVNLTTDAHGQIIDTSASNDVPAFAFNIDIATPMERAQREVFAVDLLADVLVSADTRRFVVQDVEEMKRAQAAGLISARELAAADRALREVIELVDCDALLGLLDDTWPIEPGMPEREFRMQSVPLSAVPRLGAKVRPTW